MSKRVKVERPTGRTTLTREQVLLWLDQQPAWGCGMRAGVGPPGLFSGATKSGSPTRSQPGGTDPRRIYLGGFPGRRYKRRPTRWRQGKPGEDKERQRYRTRLDAEADGAKRRKKDACQGQ